MDLLQLFLQHLASIFDIESSRIEFDGCNLTIGSVVLHGSSFFDEVDLPPAGTTNIQNYIDNFELESGTSTVFLNKNNQSDSFSVLKLRLLNQNINHGIHEILDNESNRLSLVFTGSFSGSVSLPDFKEYPEILLVICALDKNVELIEGRDWYTVFESIGPFALCQGDFPQSTLADNGLFVSDEINFSFDWNNELPPVIRTKKQEVPEEAEKAYLTALEGSTSPDIAFIRLYRVLEILFAGTFKNEISNARLTEVIRKIQYFQSISELDALRKLVEQSTSPFTLFTHSDFKELFGTHEPQGNYTPIQKWLTNHLNPIPDNLRAYLIYYIRCSLVHSKLGEKEPFLIGPFSTNQETALTHIVEDMRKLICSLVFR